MLDTIIYIPTILAYAFIVLLVVILSFIVIYVSHKVYISIYDHLPVPNAMSWDFPSTSKDAAIPNRNAAVLEKRSPFLRKSKTALRIAISLEPCYLAYIVVGAGRNATTKTTTTTTTAATTAAAATTTAATTAATTTTATITPADTTIPAATNVTTPEMNRSPFGRIENDVFCDSESPYSITQLHRLIIYYDRLSDIPMMRKCSQESVTRRPVMLLGSVLNAVVQSSIVPRRLRRRQ